jgi:hypothetical protein
MLKWKPYNNAQEIVSGKSALCDRVRIQKRSTPSLHSIVVLSRTELLSYLLGFALQPLAGRAADRKV